MASQVDICNRALQKLGADRIISITQDSVSARACNLAYNSVRDTELRAHAWNFAIKRASLAADSIAPVYGYDYAYTLPSDYLRILKNDAQEDVLTQSWKIEGGKILTNDSAPLLIRYIARITDTTLYDASFINVLSCKLAMELCEELTQSNTKRQIAAAEYKDAVREARRMNAFEGFPVIQEADTWSSGRI